MYVYIYKKRKREKEKERKREREKRSIGLIDAGIHFDSWPIDWNETPLPDAAHRS